VRTPHLCITSPWNYPLFAPDCQSHFGGWEVRIALIAKELAGRGRFRVSMVVGDHGQPHVELRDNITMYSWIGREIWGIPLQKPTTSSTPAEFPNAVKTFVSGVARHLRPILRGTRRPAPIHGQVGPYTITPGMLSIYDEVDADIYMVPGNSQFSGEVAFYALKRGKRYVFLSGSDMDYYPEYKTDKEKLDIYSVPHALKCFAIETAAAHIVQNERQAKMLRKGYNRDCTIIPNPVDLNREFPRSSCPKTILWVGKSDERVKRPSLILELAHQLHGFEFVVILNFGLPETHEQCLRKAGQLKNVTLLERVPFSQIESYFAAARLHLNTSLFEGFPNTFLQAAKYGVPTISLTVDPGEMLSRHGCGLACEGDFHRFKRDICQLMDDEARYHTLSEQALRYVRQYHDKDMILEQYERFLLSVL
jgi:glycosyltransferase involved in cell wall biosynthesis